MTMFRNVMMAKAGGGSLLPKEYSLHSFLRSDGVAYIDTGVVPDNTIEFETKLLIHTPVKSGTSAFGCWQAWNSSGFTICFGDYISYRFPVNFDAGFSTSSGVDIGVQKEQLGTLSLKGNTVNWSEGTSATFSRNKQNPGHYSIYIFAMNAGGHAQEHSIIDVYHFRLWLGGVLLRNFVPAKRKSDGVCGLYDLVTETFFTDATSKGVFTVG